MFRTHLTTEIATQNPKHDDIDTYYDNVRQIILKAADQSIPQNTATKKPLSHASIWWNNACTKAVTEKRKALRTYQNNPIPENKNKLTDMTKHCKDTAEQAKAEHWEAFCRDEIKTPADSGKLWQRFNMLRRQARPAERPLLHNGIETRTDGEKAEALAETFARASQTEHLPAEAKNKRQELDAPIDLTNDNTTPYNSDITLQEIKSAIAELTNQSKATGTDPISYHIIKQLNEPAIKMLHTFFQTCWTTGSIPQAWKKAQVIGIHKEGKPRNLPSSYRPIALTPHLGKLYERVMKERLQYHLDKTDALPTCQAGFRKGRSCMEHVADLLEDIKEANSRYHRYVTTAAFFDIRRAFDTVWHAKLLHKLQALGINGRLYTYIQNFLHQRQISVKVGAATSNTHTLDMGVPQGSVIAPLLFSTMLHDIDKAITDPSTKKSLFADDLGIRAHHKPSDSVEAMHTFQEQVTNVDHYLTDNGFQLSPDKTTFMLFSRNRRGFSSYKTNYYIKIRDTVISPSKQVKFLGVIIDQSLTWGPHCTQLIAKARRGLNSLKLLSAQRWSTPQSQLHIAQALIRSRLTYGKEVYFTTADSHLRKLQTIDMASIKIALRLPKQANNDLVYQEAGWLPLHQECRRLCANFEVRQATITHVKTKTALKPSTQKDTKYWEAKQRTKVPYIQKTIKLNTHTKELWEASNHQPTDATPWPTNHLPHWTLEKPNIISEGPKNLTKADNPHYLSALAKELIATRYKNHLQVYTDGSLQTNHTAGCAATIPDLKITKKAKLNTGISIFTAELHAIHLACNTLLELQARPNAPVQAVILTDSKSALQALNSKKTKNRKEMVQEIQFLCHQLITKGLDLTLQWIPSHSGILGNDMADREAKCAVTEGTPTNLKLSTSEVTNRIKEASRKLRNAEMQNRCLEKGWLHQPLQSKKLRKGLPRQNITLLTRLRTNCHTAILANQTCKCGQPPTLQHALNPCNQLPNNLTDLKNYQTQNNLNIADMLLPHPTLGLAPAKILSDSLIQANIAKWF